MASRHSDNARKGARAPGPDDEVVDSLQSKIAYLQEEVARLEKENASLRSVGERTGKGTVTVPGEFQPIFTRAESTVKNYFSNFTADPTSARIDISGQRYVLVRASSLSVDFLNTIRNLYSDRGKEEALLIGKNMLFDFSHAIGISDARNFHKTMQLTDPVEKLSAGPVHFAYTGWASVEILPSSNVEAGDEFCLHYHHPSSFEADTWLASNRKSDTPVCIMNAGYSSGWCEESFGLPLTAVEVSCRARGDENCTFVMAPPEHIEKRVNAFLKTNGQKQYRRSAYEIPTFFERKSVEEEIMRAREKAEESDRLKSQFLANMSHEIRTPLNSITACIDLLEGLKPSHEQEQYLSTIRASSHLLMTLLNDILDLSKIEAGQLHVTPVPVNLQNLIDQLLERFEVLSAHYGKVLEFSVVLDPELAGEIYIDDIRLEQILNNLLANAVKFTDEGKIKLVCELHDGRLQFVISDTGTGIPQSLLKRIFQEFEQFHVDEARRFGGAGLGLTIVKKLVELMRGTVKVDSRERQGTSVTISFPYNPVMDEGRPDASDESHEQPLLAAQILLVEDNAVNRLLASKILESGGHSVVTAENGQQALEKLDEVQPDLVLMDLQMPVMDGLEAVKLIRQLEEEFKLPRLPVLALTAHAMKGNAEECLTAGFDEYLTKPIEKDKLLSMIQVSLRKNGHRKSQQGS